MTDMVCGLCESDTAMDGCDLCAMCAYKIEKAMHPFTTPDLCPGCGDDLGEHGRCRNCDPPWNEEQDEVWDDD